MNFKSFYKLFLENSDDSEYLKLSYEPFKNEEILQKIVKTYAKDKGYVIEAYNGFIYPTGQKVSWIYKKGEINNVGDGSIGFYFSSSKEIAQDYANQTKNRKIPYEGSINKVLLKIQKPLIINKEVVTGNELIKIFQNAGISLPFNITDRWEWWKPNGLNFKTYVWKWINASHLQRGENWNNELRESIQKAGYDSIQHPDNSGVNFSYEGSSISTIVFDPSNIKLANSITYDDSGKVIPLSSRFDSSKDDIRY